MLRFDFNHNWTCRCLTRNEGTVQVMLPHDAMISEPRGEESLGGRNIGWFSGGDYEYRKIFLVEEEWKGQKIIFEFEGVYKDAEVYINNKRVAYRPYGYTNFYVEATDSLKFGKENEIRVIAKNSDQPNSRWYSGTGIFRPVWIWVGEEKHIPVNGVKIRTLHYDPAAIEVKVRTSCAGTVSAEILDGEQVLAEESMRVKSEDGKEWEAVFIFSIQGAKLWDCENPNLYRCHVKFGEDSAEETFGIRLLEWNSKVGFTINGERVILRGACIHHDNGVLGACSYPEAEERRVRILKESGYNALRSAHNPCSKALLDACDRQGVLVMDEYSDVWFIHKTKYDYASCLEDWWEQDLKDMVEKDYNHPCVVMYSTGNEVSETAQARGIELTGEFTRYLHELDDTRPVTCGINLFFNFLSSIGLGVYSDKKAEKEAEAQKKAAEGATKGSRKLKQNHVGSDFYNTLADLMGDYFMKCGSTLAPCDAKTRNAYEKMDIAGYNYGIFRYEKDLKKYPDRLILGSETFCEDAALFWNEAKQNKRIIGDFVWSGMDYLGETGNGAAEYSDYREKNPACQMTGGGGRIDLTGKRRAEAAFTLVAFEQENGPFIAAEPVYEKERLRLSGWQLTKAVESWSWRGCSGKKATVEVYARAASVELYVNGDLKAAKRMKRNQCRAVFHTIYEDGEISAVSYDENGREIGRNALKTAGEDTVLRIAPEKEDVEAGGLSFIQFQYTDADGIWKPMEQQELQVTVENGTLVGLGSANPYVEGNYMKNVVKTYFGEALAVIRANESGSVKVTVTDQASIKVIEIPIVNSEKGERI